MAPRTTLSPTDATAYSRPAVSTLSLVLLTGCLLLTMLNSVWLGWIGHRLTVLQESCHQCGITLGHRMPVQYILDEPECARRLLETTGIKNTRIVTELPVNASRWNRTWRP